MNPSYRRIPSHMYKYCPLHHTQEGWAGLNDSLSKELSRERKAIVFNSFTMWKPSNPSGNQVMKLSIISDIMCTAHTLIVT